MLYYQRIDPTVIGIVLALSCISFLIAFSNYDSDYVLLTTKGFHLLLAFSVMVGVSIIPFHMILSMVPFFYVALLSALLYVEFFGAVGKGAKRWLEIGVLSGQPSEFIKGLIPLLFAFYFSNRPLSISLKDFVVLGFFLLLPIILIARQPDFGTAAFVFLIAAGCYFLAGIRASYILFSGLITVITFPLLWFFYLSEYQIQRIKVFLNIDNNALNEGYHILQSKIAIGSGGFFGNGFGRGTQTQLNFIPEFHTDFVFASFSEDFGMVGGLLLIALFSMLIARLLQAAKAIEHNSERIFVSGVACMLFLSCFFNIGMVIGILPVVGVPLPWLSYGGSSLLAISATLGVAMGIIAPHRSGGIARHYAQ